MARQECQVLDDEAVFSAEALPCGRVRLALEHRHGEAAVAMSGEDAVRIAAAIFEVVASVARPESLSGAQPPARPRRTPREG